MSHRKYDIYIGSDNGSHRINGEYLSKVVEWAKSAFPEGYTLFHGKGYWDGYSEDCILLSVLAQYEQRLADSLKRLKEQLGQKAILLSRYDVDVEVV